MNNKNFKKGDNMKKLCNICFVLSLIMSLLLLIIGFFNYPNFNIAPEPFKITLINFILIFGIFSLILWIRKK